MNQIAILTKALDFLWSGVDDEEYYNDTKEKFVCHCITFAYLETQGVKRDVESQDFWKAFNEAEQTEVVQALKNEVIKRIGGHFAACIYLEAKLGRSTTMIENQVFRRELIEEILAVYESREMTPAKIAALQKVKAGREDGTYSSAYVCDNLGRLHFDGECGIAVVEAIRADIKEIIGGHFSVGEFLGHDGDKWREYNVADDVVAFRKQMIEDLIARYTAELVAA